LTISSCIAAAKEGFCSDRKQKGKMDLSLGLEGTVVIVTGAGGQIGRVIMEALLSAGCLVGAIDINASNFKRQHENLLWVLADTTDESDMGLAWQKVETHFSLLPTTCICAAALDLSFIPHHQSIVSMPVEQFRRTMDVVSCVWDYRHICSKLIDVNRM
jgi:NAD(P)-dependent dehydrogenase (short-subunit alcohol dehydrogenase family)